MKFSSALAVLAFTSSAWSVAVPKAEAAVEGEDEKLSRS